MEKKALCSVVLQKEVTDDPDLAMQKPAITAEGVHFQFFFRKVSVAHAWSHWLSAIGRQSILCFYVHSTAVLHCSTSDVFLFYRGIAVFFHPQLSLHQQVPSLNDLRGWLLMAYDIMHVAVESKHHTMQGGAVITSITNVLMSAGIHAATLYQLLQWR